MLSSCPLQTVLISLDQMKKRWKVLNILWDMILRMLSFNMGWGSNLEVYGAIIHHRQLWAYFVYWIHSLSLSHTSNLLTMKLMLRKTRKWPVLLTLWSKSISWRQWLKSGKHKQKSELSDYVIQAKMSQRLPILISCKWSNRAVRSSPVRFLNFSESKKTRLGPEKTAKNWSKPVRTSWR